MSRESILRGFGRYFITPLFAIGSAVITTLAVSSLAWVIALTQPWSALFLALVFLCETAVAIYFFKDSVPDTLAAIFIDGIFKNLSFLQKALLFLGILCAIAGGLALAALTYTSAIPAAVALFALVGLSCPAVVANLFAGILGVVGFIAYSGLLTNWIQKAIRTNLLTQVVGFFAAIFIPAGKPIAQHVLESVLKLLFTAAILVATVLGTIAALATMQKGLVQFLSLIPDANALAVTISSSVMAYVMLGVARFPWVLQTACSFASYLGQGIGKFVYRIFEPSRFEEEISWKDISVGLKGTAMIVHGLCFGALARSGGGKVMDKLIADFNVPLPPTAIGTAGETTAFIAGTSMATSVAGYSFFADKIDKKHKTIRSINEEYRSLLIQDNY